MAEQKTDVAKTTTPTQGGRRDRVAMLSISKDGTPAEVDPVIIGDKDQAREFTREQFRQNAVSVVDADFAAAAAEADAEESVQDPEIAERQKAHEKAAAAAEKAADKVVDALHES